MAVLAQNTHGCGCRPGLKYSKDIISVSERFMKPGMGIMDIFILKSHQFQTRQSHIEEKTTSVVAVPVLNTCIYSCGLVLYDLRFKMSSLLRFMKPKYLG